MQHELAKSAATAYVDADDDPRQFVHLMPHAMRLCVDRLDAKYFELSEEELKLECFGEEEPTATAQRLRIAFWDEYDRVQRLNEPVIQMRNVVKGICQLPHFVNRFMANPNYLAWMLHAPSDYTNSLKEIHQLSIRVLRKIMLMNPEMPNGLPNVKLIEAQNKIFQHVDMRIKGAIIQRIDQRNLNVNVNTEADETNAKAANHAARLTMTEIDDKLALLQKRSQALAAPSAITVDLMKNTLPDIIEVDGTEEGRKRDSVPE